MEILLDTNFIVTCIKQKLDFFSLANQLIDKSISWTVPEEVITELKTLSQRKGEKTQDRQSAETGLEMIKLLDPKIIKLRDTNTDIGIVNHILDKPIVLATLDRGLKNRVKNKILTIRGKNSLEII